ncbi:MAG: hypothetical protein L0220_27445, partial [Acidobacteria bacterium]|nr:hypothetical protein [Acidobacteriota bacterium]
TNDPIRRYLREALAESRVAHNVTGVGQESAYRGQVLCDFIKDWRGVTIGALMHITPLDYLNRVLKAFRTVAEANDLNSAMQAMLNAAQILGHKWGRLYLLDEDDQNLMVSKLCFGMEVELSERFNSGQIVLPRNESTSMSWKSIDEERPIVFHWSPQLSIPLYQTKQGLEAVVISQPYEPAVQDKQKGDFWIAFPLITPEKILGKVSLQCDPELRPEQYEMLKVLFEMLGGLWDAFLWRDRLANIREQLIREAAEKTMATIAHNIGSRLAPLDTLWSRYKNLENGNKQLIALNTEFNSIIDQTLKMIGRTKELIYSPVLRPSMFNLDEMIRSAIETGMPPQSLIINSRKKPLRVKADKDLL